MNLVGGLKNGYERRNNCRKSVFMDGVNIYYIRSGIKKLIRKCSLNVFAEYSWKADIAII